VLVQPGESVISLSLDTPSSDVTVTKGTTSQFTVTGTGNFACAQGCEEAPATTTITSVNVVENSLLGGTPADTDMVLERGDQLSIVVNATAMFMVDAISINAGGFGNPYGPDEGTYTDPTSGQTFRLGALIGRIGTGPYFLVGTTFDGTVSDDGDLRLVIWNTYDSGNAGSIIATISVQPKPTCPTSILFVNIRSDLFSLPRSSTYCCDYQCRRTDSNS